MPAMSAAPWSAWIVDAVIGFALLEAAVLIGLRAATGRGLDWRDQIANLAAGLFLMAGIRVAIAAAPWPWLVLCLAGAGAAHGLDLWRRSHAPTRTDPSP